MEVELDITGAFFITSCTDGLVLVLTQFSIYIQIQILFSLTLLRKAANLGTFQVP